MMCPSLDATSGYKSVHEVQRKQAPVTWCGSRMCEVNKKVKGIESESIKR
ncbi:hypothetical protein YC2023_085839 [Brassica napus]